MHSLEEQKREDRPVGTESKEAFNVATGGSK